MLFHYILLFLLFFGNQFFNLTRFRVKQVQSFDIFRLIMEDDEWKDDFIPDQAISVNHRPQKYNNTQINDSFAGPTEEVILKIASSSVGRLIGPRGATIKELQATYNVQISVAKHENNDNSKDATISGTNYNVQQAVEAINEKLKRAQQKYGNGERFESRQPQKQYGNDYGKRDYNFNSGTQDEPIENETIDWDKANRECVSS